jgi:hypothetical protein
MLYPPAYATPNPGQPVPPAFNEVTQALRELTGGNNFTYMVAARQLCLAVCGAEEIASGLRARGQAFDVKAVFHQELQNQILTFVLLRVLPDAVIKACLQNLQAAPADANAPTSAAGRLAAELERAAGDSEEMALKVQAGLVEQTLFRLTSQRPEVLVNLEQQYEQCSPYAATLIKTLKSSMGMMMTVAASSAIMAPSPSTATPPPASSPSAPQASTSAAAEAVPAAPAGTDAADSAETGAAAPAEIAEQAAEPQA